MLPRPARILRQPHLISAHRPTHIQHVARPVVASSSSTRRHAATAAAVEVIRADPPVTPELDPSFGPLLRNMDMSSKRRRRARPTPSIPAEEAVEEEEGPLNVEGASTSSFMVAQEGGDAGEGWMSGGDGRQEEFGSDWGEQREERRSPAAVLGSKRIGSVQVPEEMMRGIEEMIHEIDPHAVRRSYLTLRTRLGSPKRNYKPASTDEETARQIAGLAGWLPGEVAAVRNVIEEIGRREGAAWLRKGYEVETSEDGDTGEAIESAGMESSAPEDGGAGLGSARPEEAGETEGEASAGLAKRSPVVVEHTAGVGSGLWATMDAIERLPSHPNFDPNSTEVPLDYLMINHRRDMLQLGKRLASEIPDEAASVTFERMLDRKLLQKPPNLSLSTFYLSQLTTPSSQKAHLRHLLSLSSPYLVLIDHATPAGWAAISFARSFLLDLSTRADPLHILAPCPHDGDCPMASGDGGWKDICGFNQRFQSPTATRRTKHGKRGEEDKGYCYLVIKRGERPELVGEGRVGRVGAVGREAAQRERAKSEGRLEIREIEGAEGETSLEVVSVGSPRGVDGDIEGERGDDGEGGEIEERLRAESHHWPRLLAPPLKRSGHVVMDVCHPDGKLQRMTIAKSHSKQGYHDARKVHWGDLFPHEPKTRMIERKRGVRKLRDLNSSERRKQEEKRMKQMEEWTEDAYSPKGKDLGVDLSEVIEKAKQSLLETGEGVDGDKQGEAMIFRFGKDGKRILPGQATASGRGEQRRGFSSVARPGLGVTVGTVGLQKRFMSARPAERTSSDGSALRPKVTINELQRLRASGTPITCLTAYDYPTALLSEASGIDMVLVGDSLSQVALGHETTTQVTLDEILHHAKAVTRGAKTPFVFADMPFGSFEISVEDGVRNVVRVIKESGVDGVKMEGGMEILPLVQRLSSIGIAVVVHLGLQPQRATSTSGYLVQGRSAEAAKVVWETAKAMEAAGAMALLLEAIPHHLGTYITQNVSIPTIGIGAGPGTSAQVLVITDVLGVYAPEQQQGGGDKDKDKRSQPRFVRQFGNVGAECRRAVRAYREEIRGGGFPSEKESYGIKKDEWARFLKDVEEGETVGGKVGEGALREGVETEDGA